MVGFLQQFQNKLIEKWDIYLSAKVTACDIVMSGQVEPHLTISFINHPKYPMKIDKLKGIVGHLAVDLMELKQNRIVVMHSDETVMFENNDQIDGRIK